MLLTAKEAAERLRVSASVIYTLCGSGQIKHYRFGATGKTGKGRGLIRIEEEDLNTYIAENCRQIVPHQDVPARKPGLKPGGFALLRAAGFVPKGRFEVGVG